MTNFVPCEFNPDNESRLLLAYKMSFYMQLFTDIWNEEKKELVLIIAVGIVFLK